MIINSDPSDIKKQFLQAKAQKRGLFIKNAYSDVPSWSEFLKCIFEEIQTPNPKLAEIIGHGKDVNERSVGNVIITEDYYFSPQTTDSAKYFKEVLPLEKYFYNSLGWEFGLSGPKVSLGPRYVAPHHDNWDAFTLQCQGTTTWTITNPDTKEAIEYFMEPGDLLFFSQEVMHEISCNEPRAGMIFYYPDINKDGMSYRDI